MTWGSETLGQGARRQLNALGVLPQTCDSRVIQADAEGLTHVVQRNTARYKPVFSRISTVSN